MLYLRLIATLMHDLSNNLEPPTISDLFKCSSNIHTLRPGLHRLIIIALNITIIIIIIIIIMMMMMMMMMMMTLFRLSSHI